MSKVSIIVPIYNAEKFLDKCINSVLNQTYDDYELILVNDGSTDKSEEICSKYCNTKKYDKNAKIKYIFQTNSGVSAARNKGIDIAEGEFITFVDSDDYLDEKYLDTMIKAQNNYNTDLTVCAYVNYSNNENKHICKAFPQTTFYCNEEIQKEVVPRIFYNNALSALANPICRLYKAEIIKKNNLRFKENLYYNEDKLFNYIYSQYIVNFVFLDVVLYYRLIHMQSAMRIFRENIYNDSLNAYIYFLEITKKYNVDMPKKTQNRYFIELFIQDIIKTNICHIKNYKEHKEKWSEYYNYIKQDKIYDIWNNLNLSDFENYNKWKIVYLFLKLHIPFMIDVMYKIKSIIK